LIGGVSIHYASRIEDVLRVALPQLKIESATAEPGVTEISVGNAA